MKKIKELVAILIGMLTSYLFQLMFAGLLLAEGSEVGLEALVPNLLIQAIMTPMVAWLAMGFMKVSWFKVWVRITVIWCAILIPFVVISVVTVIVCPAACDKPAYWLADIVISVVLAFTKLKPMIELAEIIE